MTADTVANDGTEGLVDLAAQRTGGQVLVANDEFFAPKENLLLAEPAVFIEGKYTDHGKWMDGWETRRRRTPGHDWCIVRLGMPGTIDHVVVDTAHFRGNHPEAASLDACALVDRAVEASLAVDGPWRALVPKTNLAGHTANRLPVSVGNSGGNTAERVTHVRLAIHPDGGVARLRVWGCVEPDWTAILASDDSIDLIAIEHGGRALASSDAFFSQPINLTMPGRGRDMGDGWETRRRRGPGHDWAVLALGRRGLIEQVVVDTRHFKGNYPGTCWLEGCDLAPGVVPPTAPEDWTSLVENTPLGPDAEHRLVPRHQAPMTHVRLSIAPDGGVSRLRLLGRPV